MTAAVHVWNYYRLSYILLGLWSNWVSVWKIILAIFQYVAIEISFEVAMKQTKNCFLIRTVGDIKDGMSLRLCGRKEVNFAFTYNIYNSIMDEHYFGI